MSGECKSYRLNEPMKWDEFKKMPDDIQKIYLDALRQKYNVSDTQLAKMFGVSQANVNQYLKKKGLNRTDSVTCNSKWDKEGFYAWAYGVPKQEEVKVEEVEPEIPVEATQEVVEEETAVSDECPYVQIPNPGIKVNLINAEDELKEEEIKFKKTVPTTGSMTYEGLTFDILSSLADLLGNTKVLLSVKWDVVED